MFSARWRLFRLAGIPISLDASWLIVLALVTWVLAKGVFEAEVPGLRPVDLWLLGLGTALAYFTCIVLHELGHAVVARARGIPIRGITLFVFGGVAEMGDEPPSALSEFLMAIAGPAVSAVLAVVFGVLAFLGYEHGWPLAGVAVLNRLAWINGIVLVFNLVPAFPLDGGRVLRSILWGIRGDLRWATYWCSLLGQAFAWVLIGTGVYLFLTDQIFNGIWIGLIGLFLNGAAKSSYQQVLLRQALQGEPVRRFMNPAPVVVAPSINLQDWVQDYVYRYHRKSFPVASDGRLEGFISTQALNRYPREEWHQHTVGEAMRHDLRAVTIPPDADAFQALRQMQRTGSSRLLVTDKDQLVGIISLKDLLRLFQMKMDLEYDETGPDERG